MRNQSLKSDIYIKDEITQVMLKLFMMLSVSFMVTLSALATVFHLFHYPLK